jgi:hypothetical protein
LRHPGAGHDARRADRSGTDTDFDRVDSRIHQLLRAGSCADVAGDQVRFRVPAFDLSHRIDDARRMTVRGVDYETVDTCFDQLVSTFLVIAGGADRGGDAQPAEIIFRG